MKGEGWSKAEGHGCCNHKGRFHTTCAATWAVTARCSSHAWDAAVHTEDWHRIWYCSLTTRQQQSKVPAQTLCSHESQLASSKEKRHSSYKNITTTDTPGPLFVSARSWDQQYSVMFGKHHPFIIYLAGSSFKLRLSILETFPLLPFPCMARKCCCSFSVVTFWETLHKSSPHLT